MATIIDERTDEQRSRLTYLVVGTDTFMSGWGGASGGASYAAWACDGKHLRSVTDWVESRGEMRRVRVVTDPYRPRCAHLHIYAADEGHPATGTAYLATSDGDVAQ